MSERPIVLTTPLVTLGEPTAEVCVDGWCGPTDRPGQIDEPQPLSTQPSPAERGAGTERH